MTQQVYSWVHTQEKWKSVLTKTCICSWMFTAALIIITEKWKQSKRPSTDRQINKRSSVPQTKDQVICCSPISHDSGTYGLGDEFSGVKGIEIPDFQRLFDS